MINIAICDDTPIHLQSTADIVRRLLADRDVSIACFPDAESLMADIRGGLHPDIAILDIMLGTASGITLAQSINELLPNCQIIFITSYPQYASDVYLSEHTWFITKAQIEKYLPAALEKAFSSLEGGEAKTPVLSVKVRRTLRRIPVSEVLYLERITYRTKVVTLQEEIFTGQKPADLLANLPEHLFIRCHQSYWVHADMIFSQVGSEFHLIDGKVVPISRTFRSSALAAFSNPISSADRF